MGIVSNLIGGVGNMYAAPLGSPVPTRTFEWPSAWENIGYTAGGITLEYTPNIADLEVDQEMAPIAQMLVSERVIIRTDLAEVTAITLCKVIAAQKFATAEYMEALFGTGDLPEIMIGFEGFSPGGWGRTVYFPRAAQRSPVTIDHQRDALEVLRTEWLSMGNAEIFDGEITPQITVEGLLRVYGWTANGHDRTFALPTRLLAGSDAWVSINGVVQDCLYSYLTIHYAGWTVFTFSFTPQSGDRIQACYQIAAP